MKKPFIVLLCVLLAASVLFALWACYHAGRRSGLAELSGEVVRLQQALLACEAAGADCARSARTAGELAARLSREKDAYALLLQTSERRLSKCLNEPPTFYITPRRAGLWAWTHAHTFDAK